MSTLQTAQEGAVRIISRAQEHDPGQSEGLEQRFELQKDLVFAAPKDGGQDLAGVVLDGMPEPARVAFVPDKRPDTVGELQSTVFQ